MAVSQGSVLSKIRDFIEDFAEADAISSVGLFGSWARYEASESIALDVLAVDGSSDFEFHELVEHEGLLLDIDRIPWEWVGEVVVPEVDHRLHEVIVVHDPSGALEKARAFVEGNYRTPGRVEIRTEDCLTSADVYLSRSTSAMTRRDLETASMFAEVSLEPASHVLMDVAGVPVSRSDPIWNLRRACEGLGMLDFYRDYIDVLQMSDLEDEDAVEGLRLFEDIWRRVLDYTGRSPDVVGGLHERLRREIAYLTNPAMLALSAGRAGEMMGMHNLVGASVYLRRRLLPLLEVYAWVVSARRGEKFDYTTLFRTLSEDEGSAEVCDAALRFYGLEGLDEGAAWERVERARSVVGRVRAERRGLIEGFVG
ncbi:MAG: hypothetical protein NWF12_01830 [Candidatus Bathyarchaeota archaeon]|nr:hypothetical protein [Candidatus Bathyarchaeota archaeon]